GDGANLRQHVLPRVEDSRVGAKHGLIFAANVPGEADARLEHLVVVRDFPGRWKSWIAQIRSVGGLGGGDHGIRELLCLPTQAVVDGYGGPDLPGVLGKKSEGIVGDVGEG